MLNYKTIINIINKRFRFEFIVECIPFLIVFFCFGEKTKIIIILLFLILFIIMIKQYYYLQILKNNIINNKKEIDKELKCIYFKGADYILTPNFIFDLKSFNIINYQNIYGVLKKKSAALSPIYSHINDVIYILTKKGIIQLTTKDSIDSYSEYDYKDNLEKIIKKMNPKVFVGSSEQLKILLKEKCNMNFFLAWFVTWRKYKCEFCFLNDKEKN